MARLTQTVEVPPNMLGPKIKAHVKDIVFKKYNGCCTINVGYIHDVCDVCIVSVKTSYCSPNATAVVTFTARVVKPAVGDVVTATVVKNIAQGVLLQTQFFKVFLPDAKSIVEGKAVNVRIVATKYDKNQYNCIGEIVV
jgi:DNA-directed RNA polymerase subunit E'/Rpb7